jgi:transcriptional regulator with XRE-family HTH domain
VARLPVLRQNLDTQMTGDLNSELTELLRDMRHQAGLTQQQLAQRLGHADASHVSRSENGRSGPKPELVGRWAAACGFHAELVIHTSEITVTPSGGDEWWFAVIPLNDGPQP